MYKRREIIIGTDRVNSRNTYVSSNYMVILYLKVLEFIFTTIITLSIPVFTVCLAIVGKRYRQRF